MDNLGYLFAGFAVIWVLVFGYLWYLGRAIDRLQRRLDASAAGSEKPRS